MIKFEFWLEDVHGTIERQEDGAYLLKAVDGEGTEDEKRISSFQAASLLFAGFDEQPEEVDQIFDAAQNAQKGFKIELIP